MLFTRGRLGPGETVMINSVGSGIGSAAVQLAKLAGAFVIANASSDEKLARASELGMDVGINHQTQDVVAEVMRRDGRPAASRSSSSTSAVTSSRRGSTRWQRTAAW